jgi:hypothetical protein|tara:strand:- start:871 stop:1035 length:165 start_codon:yes stop_codon:yes gene_type:complete
MLFKFDKFWKIILVMISFWLVFACAGYEFTTITLLSLITANSLFGTTHDGKKKK